MREGFFDSVQFDHSLNMTDVASKKSSSFRTLVGLEMNARKNIEGKFAYKKESICSTCSLLIRSIRRLAKSKTSDSAARMMMLVAIVVLTWVFAPAISKADTLFRHDTDTSVPMTKINVTQGLGPPAAGNLHHRWVVAGRDDSGNLRIEGYRFTGISRENISRDWATGAGAIRQVAVAWVGANGRAQRDDRFITAVRDGAGRLRLILWRYGETDRLNTASFMPDISNSQISIATLYNRFMVTAAREADNDIRLDLWRVGSSTSIVHLDTIIAGSGSWANVVMADMNEVVAVFRNTDGRLSTQKYRINGQDELDWQSGWVSSLTGKVRAREFNDRFIIVAFRTDLNTLGVYSFDTNGDINWHSGNIQSGNGTGTIQDLSINGNGPISTAVRDSEGNLKLIRWSISSSPPGMERDTDNEVSGIPLGEASHIAVEGGGLCLVGVSDGMQCPGTSDQLLTAMRDSDGNSRFIVFHSH